MGRPRKDGGEPEARQRLIDAFWTLLEANQLREITVGMITSEAKCNRGTFYYHFADMDALVSSAIESEFLGTRALSRDIFSLVAGMEEQLWDSFLIGERAARLSLVMEKGGSDIVNEKVKSVVVKMWRAILCTNGNDLAPATRLIIEYATSGMIGLLAANARGKEEELPAIMVESGFLRENAVSTLSLISKAQGIPAEDVVARLQIASQLMEVQVSKATA